MDWLYGLLIKFLSIVTSLMLVFSPAASFEPGLFVGAPDDPTIRQEINILDATLSGAGGSWATSSERILITPANYTGATYYFEIVGDSTVSISFDVTLRNATSSAIVATANIPVLTTAYKRVRSSAFTAPTMATEYIVTIDNTAGATKNVRAARVIVLQTSSTLSNTETQIEIGSATTSAVNTTSLPLKSPKYWYYDSTKWDASPTFYAEVTYKANPVASSTIYSVSATATPTFYTYKGSTGVGYVVGEAWGGGGGGDGAASAATIGGGGGAGGAYARSTTTVTAGSLNRIGVGRGGAEGVAAAADTASSTLTTASGLVLKAVGGGGGADDIGGATTTTAGSTGDFITNGGGGGPGQTTADTGGGGGGAAGPNGNGVQGGVAAASGPGGAGGNGNASLGGAGGAGGNGGDDTCNAELGGMGVNNVLGAGGGGGADGDVSSTCGGGDGGRPGGGGGGSDEGTTGLGGPGQIKITEYIGTVGVALEKDDGAFGSWTFVSQIVVAGKTSTTSERVRGVAFTPETDRNYRIVASTTNATSPYDIYNAKIVVTQSAFSEKQITGGENASGISGGTAGAGELSQAQAQEIVFSQDTTVSAVRLKLRKNSSPADLLNIDIVSTLDGSVVVGADIDPSTLTTSLAEYTIPLTPTLLTAGTYFIQLTRTGTRDSTNNYSIGKNTFGGDTYPAGTPRVRDNNSWITSGGDYYFIVVVPEAPTLVEPQYLLANQLFDAGTSLQDFDTSFDPAEWDDGSGGTTQYFHEASSIASGGSDIKLQDFSGTPDVTGSTITDISNRERTTAMTMPAASTLDTIATTNNGDIFSSRIIVQWAYDTAVASIERKPQSIFIDE